MKRLKYVLIAFATTLSACSDSDPVVSLGIDDFYSIYRMQKLPLQPALTGEAYRWWLVEDDGSTTLLSDEREYIFIAQNEGEYRLRYQIIDDEAPMKFDFVVKVYHEEVEYSPYISEVYEYCPAPGQFINSLPEYEAGDTYADMLRKATESISGEAEELISLGACGGYVTFGFDHTVVNAEGKDIRIWANAFYDSNNPMQKGGTAEPGIVMVALDQNCNGLPDDPWFELAGSEYYKPSTIHDYQIVYNRPDPDREVVRDVINGLTDVYYMRWTDSEGAEGYVSKNTFHTQEYFPQWLDDEKLTFNCSRLAQNARKEDTYYLFMCYDWGYVDNHPNAEAELNGFDIDWAVDADGKPVSLPGIDFVRVYSAINQSCGWLGETSTEISKAADLHLCEE